MPEPRKLSAAQARKLADANDAHKKNVAAAAATEKRLKELRARYVDRVPAGVEVTAGGVLVKRTVSARKGYEVPAGEVTNWTIKRLVGP